MKHILLTLLLVITVCRIFCFTEHNRNQVAREIQTWLVGKKIVSTTADSHGGYGMGWRTTCITILAEIIEK